MAPKKPAQKTMSLGDFLSDQTYGGSWADEVEDTFASGTQPLPPSDRVRSTYGNSSYGADRGYARDSYPQKIPDKPPYTAHLGNLPYDATVETVTEFFDGCDITSVRIIEDREQQRPKGFAYAEFANVEGLKKALTYDGSNFQGRTIKIKIAEPARDREGRGESNRDLSDWTRKGPLADLPPRGNDRRQQDFGERRPPREQPDDGKMRDLSTWERKGPLSPLPQPERSASRDDSRPRTTDASRNEPRNRRQSPAAWGEGRQEGSRPPRRDNPERPERVPSAAERDMQWRSNMRPDLPTKSPSQSRDGSEAPPSPAGPSPVPTPAVRPKLNLQKRTVSEAADLPSPATAADSKASPFGGARPIDTATREREIEEKRVQQLKEKKEAEDKAKEERRLAKEAAAAEEAAKAAAEAEASARSDAVSQAGLDESQEPAATETEVADTGDDATRQAAPNGPSADQRIPTRPREQREPREPRESREPREPREPRGDRADFKSRAAESGNWRQVSGEQKPPRAPPSGPRRGGGPPRGPRHDGPRPPKANGATSGAQQQQQQQQSPSSQAAEGDAPAPEEDGWTTVRKGGARNQGPRTIAS